MHCKVQERELQNDTRMETSAQSHYCSMAVPTSEGGGGSSWGRVGLKIVTLIMQQYSAGWARTRKVNEKRKWFPYGWGVMCLLWVQEKAKRFGLTCGWSCCPHKNQITFLLTGSDVIVIVMESMFISCACAAH